MASKAAQALLVLLALITGTWLAMGLDRGLELTDESYYIVSAIHAGSIELFFTPFHWVSGPMWAMTTDSLFAFRAMGLLLIAGSGLVLAAGLLRAAGLLGVETGRLGTFGCAATGALMYGALLNFTPSYNLLATAWSSLALGLTLLAVGRSPLWLAIAGASLGIAVLSKFPTGASTASLMLVAWLVLTEGRARWQIALAFAAALVVLAAAVTFMAGWGVAAQQFRAGIDIVWASQGDGNAIDRLVRSAMDTGRMLRDAVEGFPGPLMLLAIAFHRRWNAFAIVGVGWLAIDIVRNGHLEGGYDRFAFLSVPLVAITMAILLAKGRELPRGWRLWLLIACIGLHPFAVSVGTWNPLQIQIVSAMGAWGTLIGLLAFAQPLRLPAVAIAILFSVTALWQVLGVARQPYRMDPLELHTQQVMVRSLGQLRVDPATAAMVSNVEKAAEECAIQPGQPFIDLYNLPAVGLMLEGKPVVSPWLLDDGYASRVLRNVSRETLARATLAVQHGAKMPPELAAFPQGWKLCGKAVAAVDGRPFEVWAPER